MTEEDNLPREAGSWRNLVIPAVAGGVAGVIAVSFIKPIERWASLQGPERGEHAALLLGWLYISMAMGLLVLAVAPSVLSRFLDCETEEDLRGQRALLFAGGLAMALSGTGLTLLSMAEPVGTLAVGTVLPAAIVAFLAAMVCAVIAHFKADEMYRQLNIEIAAWSGLIGLVFIGGWSMLAHLGTLLPLRPIDLVTLLFGLWLISSLLVSARRGLLKAR